jgi:cobyrinic acid a,c-diamide synthase
MQAVSSDQVLCVDLPQAKKTVGQYVEYISKYVEGVLQQMNNEAAMQQQLQQVQQQGERCYARCGKCT